LGQETDPSLSAEGTRVAYSWNGDKQDNFDIYVKLIGPGPPLRLTTDPARDFSPTWSKDGSSIAFLRELPEGKARVMIVPALGGPQRVIADILRWPTPAQAYPGPHLTWTPDGKGLIVSQRRSAQEPFALYYLALESGQFRRITNPPQFAAGDTAPALSPDGRTLVFRRSLGFAIGHLYKQVVDASLQPQGESTILTPEATSATSPAFPPDGRSVLFTDGNYYEPVMARIGLPLLGTGGGKQESLGVPADMLTLAGSSSKLVYAASRIDSNLWEVQFGDGEPKLVELSLLSSTKVDSGAQYSPDDKRIAFHSQRSGNPEVWVADRDGRNAQQLTFLGDSAAPRWSPDGSQILFLARHKGTEKIYVIPVNGGNPRQITTGPGRDHTPTWSRDGKTVFFRSSRSGSSQIWQVPAAGGAEVQVTKSGGDLAMEAPDHTLYYTRQEGGDGSVWKLTRDGKEVQVLPSVYPMTNLFVSASVVWFTPQAGPDGGTTLQRMRFTNGKVEVLARLPRQLWFGLSVSPDERSVLFSQVDHQESNLMLIDRP
jgi:Tol biopolymer transport system component